MKDGAREICRTLLRTGSQRSIFANLYLQLRSRWRHQRPAPKVVDIMTALKQSLEQTAPQRQSPGQLASKTVRKRRKAQA